MGHVTPDWTIRVGGREDVAAFDPAWADADDRTLVGLCLAGHRAAFDVVVERHRRQVYQLCYRYVGNHEDAADLAQDAFIRAFRGLKGFKGESNLSTWLYRIAVNVCLNRLALKAPQGQPLEPAELVDLRAERPDAALLRDERAAEVRAAIRQLPPKQRATLILRIYHELPHEEIAGILGSSVGAAKANLFHALANLKKLLR
jgi:RNA polymerase sigma-70 factor (ECF subfamily)